MAFAATLQATDHVALEATGNALAIARLLEPHVARVVIANSAAIKGIGSARAKTDQLDARTLAQLLSAGFLPGIWAGDEPHPAGSASDVPSSPTGKGTYPPEEPGPCRAAPQSGRTRTSL